MRKLFNIVRELYHGYRSFGVEQYAQIARGQAEVDHARVALREAQKKLEQQQLNAGASVCAH